MLRQIFDEKMFVHRLLPVALLLSVSAAHAQQACSYQTWSWDTNAKKAVNHTTIRKPYAEISGFEVDAYTGCSVCEQDQRTISIPPLKPFKLCHIIAPQVGAVLQQLLDSGEAITTVVGYRVGRTRGAVDTSGVRTQFSNHAYGIALDINPERNGLYDNCIEFNESCRLIRGGAWQPGRQGSITGDSPIVSALENIGLKWGGEILGHQKDFMHFSPSGY